MFFSPNIISFMGIGATAMFVYFMYIGWWWWALLASTGVVFDFLDGYVARKKGSVTLFGALWDSSLDRVGDAGFILAFALAGLVGWVLAVGLLIVSFLTSYVRARAEALMPGRKFDHGLIERPERIIVMILALGSALLFPDDLVVQLTIVEILYWGLLILAFASLVWRAWWARKILVTSEYLSKVGNNRTL